MALAEIVHRRPRPVIPVTGRGALGGLGADGFDRVHWARKDHPERVGQDAEGCGNGGELSTLTMPTSSTHQKRESRGGGAAWEIMGQAWERRESWV